MDGFVKILEGLADFEDITEGLAKGQSPVSVTGVADSVRAHLIFSVCKKAKRGAFIISSDMAHARAISDDINFFFPGRTFVFPERDLMFYDVEAAANDIKKKRLEVLETLLSDEGGCAVITTVEALLSLTVPYDAYKSRALELKCGDEIEIEELCRVLSDFGYRREEMVEGAGQFSVRGGIVDYFPFWSDTAFRIEFFDTEVDSIRRFYAETQRTAEDGESCTSARITPADELVTDSEMRSRAAKLLRAELDTLRRKRKRTEEISKLTSILERDSERIESGISFPSLDKYIPFLYGDKIPTVADYIGDRFITFIDDPSRVGEAHRAAENTEKEKLRDMLERGIIPKSGMRYAADYTAMLRELGERGMVSLSPLMHSAYDFKPKRLVSFTAKSLNGFNGKMEFFYDALDFYRKNKYRVLILAGSERRAENLHMQLDSDGVQTTLVKDFEELPGQGNVYITHGSLSRSFEYPLIRFAVICDREIFGGERKKRRRRRIDPKNRIESFNDLDVGDFVVHQNHGIGQYTGIQRLTVEGTSRDYLKIVYKGGDCLYVPADQLDLIYKHVGTDAQKVKLNRLGGQEWNKAKQRAKASCEDMAKELIELYAQRDAMHGIRFADDTEWQHDFEAAFPYEETDDQLRSIAEVKADMEKPRPMERLLCGDVGYGKTEVAMRAAFKAVMSGYQVAYLVPTTILANQHYNNFRQRMRDYPISVAMLSRFCTPAQQKIIVKELKSGEIDIVIGTHKLLQKSVQYKKLGLLIIDEEQRFGVAHKERIKEMKKEIDVLTLSATPIPRTLHMSMTGIRDMSVIAEPPGERYPVATYVMEYDRDVVREAILREVGRGGQVYYLHNRVQGIESAAAEISKLVPDLRVATAHGRMSETELENIMMGVSEGDIDVLVCTTIIETGLDIPNVNTIIIEDADRLGLSQLYQLRGRVGRSNRLAYAYLTFRRDKALNEDAQKRLRAIKEFTEFGSGFKIALRDLEIRGTGNIIGPQQSGHMETVGYEMYCKLLAEAVGELRGMPNKTETETSVDLPVDAFIPEKYIKAHSQRLSAYRKIAAIESDDDFSDVYDELLDRYGDVPESVENLMTVALIRRLASKKKFTEVKGTKTAVELLFNAEDAPDLTECIRLAGEAYGRIQIKSGTRPKVVYSFAAEHEQKKYLANIKEFIEKL